MKIKDRKDLKIQFIIKDSSPNKIAKKLGINHQCVYQTMSGIITSKRVIAELERVLELPYDEIKRAYQTKYIPPNADLRDDLNLLKRYENNRKSG